MSKLQLPAVKAAFEKYNKNVIKAARSTLTKEGRNVTKEMYNSLGFNYKAFPNSIQNDFVGNFYADFQDKGVKGNQTAERAPDSPYSFKSSTSMVPFQPILEWVTARRFQFRNRDTGQFMTFSSTAFLIARSIPKRGLEATEFLSRHAIRNAPKLADQLQEAFSIDFGNALLDDRITVDDM
jgi:hypothetical protein